MAPRSKESFRRAGRCGSEQAQPLLADFGVCPATVGAGYAVPLGVWPEQHIAQAVFVAHDGISPDHGIAPLASLRVRVEAPLGWVELLHGPRNIREAFF